MTTPSNPQQSLVAGIVAAVAGAAAGATAWAVLTTTTDFKIGIAAVGVGALTGFLAGRAGGNAPGLPVIAAVIGLLGCIVGDVLIDAHEFSRAVREVAGQDLSMWTVVKEMVKDPADTGWPLYKEGFKALDALFYALAASAAFRLATSHGAPPVAVPQPWAPPTGEPVTAPTGEAAPEV